jgi:hypothetical protein
VEVTLLGAGAAFESRWIRLADLKGNLFSYPETDEQYPTLWSQQRGVLLQLLGSPDPAMQAVLSHPENLALVKRLIGLEELVIPDEESRTKQYREIAQLVAEVPVSSAGFSLRQRNPQQDPASQAPNATSFFTGAQNQNSNPNSNANPNPTQPQPPHIATPNPNHIAAQAEAYATETAADSVTMLPSVMPDEFADNHRVELEACMRWFSSDAGQVAKIEAPAGYANVRAHAMLHKSYLLKQQGALLQHPATLLPPRPSK